MTGSAERVTVTRTVLGFFAVLATVFTTTLLVVLVDCFSLLAAIAGAFTKMPATKSAPKAARQN
jgi:hypothetical protein